MPTDSLVNRLLRALFLHTSLTAREASEILRTGGNRASLVGIYKAFGALVRSQAVIKEGENFILSVSWLLDRLGEFQSAYDRLNAGSFDRFALPQSDVTLSWRFQTLRQMDRFWVHLMFLLFETVKNETIDRRVMLQWSPRLWYPHVDLDVDAQNLRAMKRMKAKVKLLVGGDSFLDRLPSKTWPASVYECKFAPNAFPTERRYSYCCIGQYLITVRVSKQLSEEMDDLFDRVSTFRSFTKGERYFLFESKTYPVLSLERATKRSARIAARLSQELD